MEIIIRIQVVADDCVHLVVVIREQIGCAWEFECGDTPVGVAQEPMRRVGRVDVIADDVAFAVDILRNGPLT